MADRKLKTTPANISGQHRLENRGHHRHVIRFGELGKAGRPASDWSWQRTRDLTLVIVDGSGTLV